MDDLRRSFATHCTEQLGVDPLVVDRILNHVPGAVRSVAAVYQRWEYLEEELMNCPQSAHEIGEPHEGTLVNYSHQPASEGSKRLHPSKRGPGLYHRHRPSQGSSESHTLQR